MLMKTGFLHYAIIVCLALIPCALFAQADIHFSQFYETSILRNPALIGVSADNYKVSAYYRSQWSSITNPYQTLLIDAEYRFPLGRMSQDFLSVGILGFSDQAGDLDQKISGFYPALCINKLLDANYNAYLSLGFTCGYLQYSFDPSKATFNNQFQGGVYSPFNSSFENIPNPKMSLVDIGSGLNFNFSPDEQNSGTYVLGVSGYHFSRPSFSYDKTPNYVQNIRWNVNADMMHDLGRYFAFQVHANYAQQGAYNESVFGALIGWRIADPLSRPDFELDAGALYRINDAIIPVVKLKYKSLGIGVSYDVNTSALKEASNTQGGLEITLSVSGQFPPNGDYRKTVCPRFF